MSREERSAAITVRPVIKFDTTTLLVIEDERWKTHRKQIEKDMLTVTIADTPHPIVATLSLAGTQDVFYNLPIARFNWKPDKFTFYAEVFFKEKMRFIVDASPFSDPKKEKGVTKIHKIVCKGKADDDGNFSRVLEDHIYTARPISCPTITLPQAGETTSLVFVYDYCLKTSYELDQNEKSTNPRQSPNKQPDKDVETALKTAEGLTTYIEYEGSEEAD